MQLNKFEKFFGSGFYTGYIPFASGTFGSLLALLIYFIPGFEKIPVITTFIIIFAIAGKFLGDKFEKVYGKDPAECTIDEVVGMWISLLYIPKSITNALLCFLIWRIFDIIKPFPAKDLEKIPGGAGIMLDDIVSALYTLIVVHIILKALVYF